MFSIPSQPKPWHSYTPITLPPSSSTQPFHNKSILPLRISNTLDENSQTKQSSAGKIKRQVLTQEGRTKLNSYPDREFYAYPRFVTHVDDGFISTLTKLYRDRLRPGWEILDLMSSWVSHLPKEVVYKRVVGHGLNAQELAKSPRLDYFFVKDLNQDQKLELESCSFDAVLCTVSVQYLQQPEKVFAEVFRVLRPGGVFIVSFSNRLFYEKAVSAWRDGTGYSRVQLVVQYFQCVEGFTQPEIIRKLPSSNGAQAEKSPFSWFMRLLGLFSGGDPFYAVIAYKNFKPLYE
ncbi:Methyltransferase type 11 [Dillenia turbinata]|uniref:Methyltransferase type 11 n=1 Tax=Dillenia turbinata TaxID=194707 RepID=A0AAN8Z882_9MAGN